MDWLADATSTDSYINSSIYGNLGQGEGIDLRIEMHSLLYGGLGRVSKGHWIILRKYDRVQPSEYYDKRHHEGVGGPPYEYTDYLLKTRRVPMSKSTEKLFPLKAGMDLEDIYIYYFEYTVNPRVGDDIFELSWSNHAVRPSIGTVKPNDRFRVERTHPYRLEQGNIQYWLALGKRDEISW